MWVATGVFVASFVLISTEKVNKTITAILGACIFVFLHVVEGDNILGLIDWNVIFVLIGMMLIVGITKRTGLFQYVAIKAAKLVKGHPIGLLVLLALITAGFSAILDNVTTVLILGPVALLLAVEMGVPPILYLATVSISSNIGGTATLIGDPPNIMIGSSTGLGFLDFVMVNGPIVVIILIAYVAFLYLFYKKKLQVSTERRARILEFDESKSITDKGLLIKSLVVLVLVIVGLTLHSLINVEPAIVALGGAFLLVLLTERHDIDEFFHEVEWGTIFFFIGLFVMVQGLEQLGVIKILAQGFIGLTGGDLLITTVSLMWFAGIFSAFVDNIPFVATMIPLLQSMGTVMGAAAIAPLWWTLSLGACLGGNGTLIGSSANVVAAGIARKNGMNLSFVEFLKFGFPITMISLALATVYVVLRFFVFGVS